MTLRSKRSTLTLKRGTAASRTKPAAMTAKSATSAKLALVPPHAGAGVVRLARVAEARRRIQSGWYDRAEVRDRLVEAVLQEIREH